MFVSVTVTVAFCFYICVSVTKLEGRNIYGAASIYFQGGSFQFLPDLLGFCFAAAVGVDITLILPVKSLVFVVIMIVLLWWLLDIEDWHRLW